MVKDLRHFNIKAVIEPTDAQMKQDIQNWIEKPLSEYILSYLNSCTNGFNKDVDWSRVTSTNAVVSDLGIYYLFSCGVPMRGCWKCCN